MYRIQQVEGIKVHGPYVPATVDWGEVSVSGQIGTDGDGNLVDGGIEAQTHQVMQNLGRILAAAHVDFGNVKRASIYVASPSDFSTVNAIYGSYFPDGKYTARATVVPGLLLDAGVEISMVARQPIPTQLSQAALRLYHKLRG